MGLLRRLPLALSTVLGGGKAESFPAALLTDLVLALNMEETSGTRYDASGYSNDALETGTVTYDSGIVLNAAKSSNPGAAYLSVAHNAEIAAGDRDFEYSVWIYAATISNYMNMIGCDDRSNRGYVLRYETGNKLSFLVCGTINASTYGLVTSDDTVNVATWANIHFWHDSVNNKLGIRINGGADKTANYAGGAYDNGTALRIFNGGTNASGGTANLRIDRVYRWNRVLTADERTLDYGGGSPKQLPI